MPNLALAIKTEISRIARKELRQQTQSMRKALAQQRREIALLKRETAALEKAYRTTFRTVKRVAAAQLVKEARPVRFSAKGLHSHRVRLGLSAQALGTLLGVSSQTVYNWEQGKTSPGADQKSLVAAFRKMGKRQVAAALEQPIPTRA